jgi:hypothetical protein
MLRLLFLAPKGQSNDCGIAQSEDTSATGWGCRCGAALAWIGVTTERPSTPEMIAVASSVPAITARMGRAWRDDKRALVDFRDRRVAVRPTPRGPTHGQMSKAKHKGQPEADA